MRAPRHAVLLLALAAGAAACFNDEPPTAQVGGTKYDIFFSIPAAAARPNPAAAVTIRQRTPVPATGRVVDTLTLTLSNLVPLTGNSAYAFYLLDGRDGSARPIAARITLLRTDTSFNAVGVVTSRVDSSVTYTSRFLRGLQPNQVARARISTVAGTADSIGSFTTHVIVTIQADTTAPAYTSTTPKPLSFRFRSLGANQASATDDVISANGNAIFGNFYDEATATRPYSVAGTGRGGLWDRARDGKLWVAGLAFSLSQPPVGYYYQPWIRDARTGRGVPFGELRDTATGASLFDADLRPITGPVASIPSARFSSTEDSIGAPIVTFNRIDLVLEPKRSALAYPGPTAVLRSDFGDTITFRGIGALLVDVQRGGQAVGNASVLVQTPGTGNLLGAPRPATTRADGETPGKVIITGLPSDSVDVVVYASGTATPVTKRVQVVRRDTVAVTVTLP